MAINTLIEAEIWTIARTDQGDAVLLRPIGAEIAVPIFIGPLETQALLLGMASVPQVRPLTHDLMVKLINTANVEIDRIEISDFKEGTFFARIIVIKDGVPSILDSRPSDALALAVRIHCRVYIAEYIIDELGIAVNLINGYEEKEKAEEKAEMGKPELRENEKIKKIEDLEKRLKIALNDENYEDAAKIRDELQALDNL